MDLALFIKEEQGMLDKGILKEIISILMQSASYFCLTAQERLFIIKHLMKSMGVTAKYKGGSNV